VVPRAARALYCGMPYVITQKCLGERYADFVRPPNDPPHRADNRLVR
jgi:hypothetical protein